MQNTIPRHTPWTGSDGPRRTARALLALASFLLLMITPCSALYNFDGFPLTTIAQGEVNGQALQYSVMGLQNSPRTLEFDLPDGAEVQWARTYIGVWGGTPRYTGWVQLAANGNDFGRTTLYGQDDRNPDVLCTGYGVYWTMWETTKTIRTGHNILIATTSQGQPESKLDGRIYGVTTVVVAKIPGGNDVRYWILEGNTNLHGQGWSADAGATQNDNTSAQFTVHDNPGSLHGNLTTIELTSTKGLPDYLMFNGQDLGEVVSDALVYPAGAMDIADEVSFNDGYKNPIPSRYWDTEIFDVTGRVQQGTNTITFLRGRDLNGDGTISSTGDKPEGEDYLHPVFAMLTLDGRGDETTTAASGTATGTDLAIAAIDIDGAYDGGNATVTATLQNFGSLPPVPVTVTFTVDGDPLDTRTITVDPSGIQKVSAGWQASSGTHTVRAEVRATGDGDSSNNFQEKQVTVGSLPDLVVSLEAPHRPGGATTGEKSPLSPLLAGAALLISLTACHLLGRPLQDGRSLRKLASVLCTLLIFTVPLSAYIPGASAAGSTSLSLLPVIVKNAGGSDAPAFTVTIYLDGEKIATKPFNNGLAAGQEIRAEIPVHTSPGLHAVRVIVDEEGRIRDGNRRNNVAESAYDFP